MAKRMIIPTGPTRHVVRLTRPAVGAHLDQSPCPIQVEQQQHAANTQRSIEVGQQTNVLLQNVYEALNELETRRAQSMDELQLVAVEMAVAIAARFLGESTDGEAIKAMVDDAVARLGAHDKITIHLHPEDLIELQKAAERSPPESAATKPEFVADTHIARGDCEVTGLDFRYVTRMQLVLDEIRVGLLESLGKCSG